MEGWKCVLLVAFARPERTLCTWRTQARRKQPFCSQFVSRGFVERAPSTILRYNNITEQHTVLVVHSVEVATSGDTGRWVIVRIDAKNGMNSAVRQDHSPPPLLAPSHNMVVEQSERLLPRLA